MSTTTVSAPLPARADVPVDMTWDLSKIFATVEAWDTSYATTEALIAQLPAFKGKLKRSGKQLLAFFTLRDQVGESLDRLYVYASMKADEDTANTANQEREEKIRGLWTKFAAAVSFSTPELLSLKPERLDTFLAKTPALKLWKQQLDELNRERAHVRSPEVEELLAQQQLVAQGKLDAGRLRKIDHRRAGKSLAPEHVQRIGQHLVFIELPCSDHARTLGHS